MDSILQYVAESAPYMIPAVLFAIFVLVVGRYMIEKAEKRERDSDQHWAAREKEFDVYLEKRDQAFGKAMERMRDYMRERDERFERSLDKIETRTVEALERLSAANERLAESLAENTKLLAQHTSAAQLAISKILEPK